MSKPAKSVQPGQLEQVEEPISSVLYDEVIYEKDGTKIHFLMDLKTFQGKIAEYLNRLAHLRGVPKTTPTPVTDPAVSHYFNQIAWTTNKREKEDYAIESADAFYASYREGLTDQAAILALLTTDSTFANEPTPYDPPVTEEDLFGEPKYVLPPPKIAYPMERKLKQLLDVLNDPENMLVLLKAQKAIQGSLLQLSARIDEARVRDPLVLPSKNL